MHLLLLNRKIFKILRKVTFLENNWLLPAKTAASLISKRILLLHS
ncbi:hypothetical protein LINGRAHAP2_LOCUS19711 [Linum grandiflorum]